MIHPAAADAAAFSGSERLWRDSMEKFVVSRDESIYEAWPDVVLTDAGTLVCVFSECTHHRDRTLARLCIVRSFDRGRTWTEKSYLSGQGTKKRYYNCARITRHRDGTLYILCDLITTGDENREAFVHLWKSTDDGATWEGPILTPGRGIVPDRLLELSDGRWLIAAHTAEKNSGKLTEYVWTSDDRGQTWSERITAAEDARYNLCEASMLEAENGTIVCYLRENSGMGYDCMKTISTDRGEHWSPVTNVPIPGCHRPTAGFLRDGRILITYRFMQGGSGFFGAYQNVFGALMQPETALETERKKQSSRLFPIDYDRNPEADTGYTGWVQFEDGEILVVNYIMDDAEKAYIRAISFRAEEVAF